MTAPYETISVSTRSDGNVLFATFNAPPVNGSPDDASLGMLFRNLSEIPTVTVAKPCGRARGAGSEFLLACDMRFASRENAVLGQPEVGIGTPPGAGAIQHLTRLLGRGRALEAVPASADFDAELADRYGSFWLQFWWHSGRPAPVTEPLER
ncbi:enoyl-CoA hydratase/isomerase family protein [Streptomyces decoyicus]|uniref:enoyl-CoA hydratase/isomerase family protein n=1 Tax=Streptomyces decoyicus TaxID=249567 RepID=UPI0033B3B02C